MLNWPQTEDTVLLTIILIEAALLLFLLFRILNRARTSISSRRSERFCSSICTCFLALSIIGIFTFIFLQERYQLLDDDEPPPTEV